MTLSKGICAQRGFPTSQIGSRTREVAWTGQKLPYITLKSSRFALLGDLTGVTLATNHSVFIKWSRIKLFGLKRGFLHHKEPPDHKTTWIGQKTPKIIPKISCSTLARDLTGVTLAANHSVLIKWAQVKLLVLKRGFLHHKVAPWPHQQPELTAITQNHTKNIMFHSARGQDRCYIGGFLYHKVASRLQKRPALAKNPKLLQK